MRTSKELTATFMKDLRTYNLTNFKTIEKADLSKKDATVHKAFSSVVTRYFIFREKHPEITDEEHKILYFKLKLDLIATYFSEYPDTTTDNLVAFQLELRKYVKEYVRRESDDSESEQASSLSDIQLGSDNKMPIQQQQESVSVAS